MKRTQTQLLKDHHLRSTSSRAAILSLFLQNERALSYSDIEKKIAASYDRVTVYRTLKTFLDSGMIHKVLDDGGSLKYALCDMSCSTNEHHHEHVHFKCTSCGQTNCLDQVAIPSIQLPNGYSASELNLLIQGVCDKCRKI
jgi:Fur family transcriptional regulator, ferric uptake regulator